MKKYQAGLTQGDSETNFGEYDADIFTVWLNSVRQKENPGAFDVAAARIVEPAVSEHAGRNSSLQPGGLRGFGSERTVAVPVRTPPP